MRKAILFFFISIFVFKSCIYNNDASTILLKTDSFTMGIDGRGAVTEFTDNRNKKNFLDQDTSTFLMSLRIDNEIFTPISASISDNLISLNYKNEMEARIQVEEKESYLTFELLSLTNQDSVELILWGPYSTTIGEVIGETVGVVRGQDFALGIQSLNIKTLGGYPWNESDRMPAFDIFRAEDPGNMHPKKDGSVLYRVEAAKPTPAGSSLQAYCRNRNQERIIEDFKHSKIVAPPHMDGGIIGSKIALFGTPREEALETIGKIEIAESLPHPKIDGQWGKTARGAAAAYIITNFTEDNVDEAIELTKKAGLKYLYHYGKTFESWGHFELYKGEFPNGVVGLKNCVDKAEAQGIKVGTHFLSNFISTNDPYVTPIPDKRLAKVGSSKITEDINSTSTEIPIQSPEYFNQMENNTLKTVWVEDELIRYNKVSESAPWRLLDCQRGAFNTIATDHRSGTEIAKLLDHGYKVFLTNADLTIEMSNRMADLYNKTGLRQISFDGLEGNRSTGLGTYGESLMPYTWYNSLSDDLKNHLIIDASRTTHFFWHIYSRMNWGEPWYGGFRESQTEYRFNNQAYFKRNYMPGMLGWFKMTPETSVEDIEWLLARASGYDAGYAFVTELETIEKNGNSNIILELIGEWEKLRIGNVFSERQKEEFRDSEKEFSLRKVNNKQWTLSTIHTEVFKHDMKTRQPGEPLHSTFELTNNGNEQTLGFIITAVNCDVQNVTLEINNYKETVLPGALKKGQIIKYNGGNNATVYNDNWQPVKVIEINPNDFNVNSGAGTISVDCSFNKKGDEPYLKLEIRTLEEEQDVNLD